MFNFIARILIFLLGATLIFDVFLPCYSQDAVITRVYRQENTRTTNERKNGAPPGYDYFIALENGPIDRCEVGLEGYLRLHKGEHVRVSVSSLFKYCADIERGDDTMYSQRLYFYLQAIAGLAFVLKAFFLSADDKAPRRPWRRQ